MTAAPVHSLRDLAQWPSAGTDLAVLGHPIGHSLSPPMQGGALARLAERDPKFAGWRYHRFDVPPAELPAALRQLRAKGFRGVNLTVPHKVLAVGLVAAVAEAARPAGAVNTLLAGEAGWVGYNTDGYGLSAALRQELGAELPGADVILLGAGGAARGAAVECLQQGCASLQLANRSPENLAALLALLGPLAGAIPLAGFDPVRPPAGLPRGAWLINATSAGLRPGDPAPIELNALPPLAGVFDLIYNPPETALLRQARQLGLPAANGLAMLVHQGAKSLEIWSGAPAAETAPWMSAALAALGS